MNALVPAPLKPLARHLYFILVGGIISTVGAAGGTVTNTPSKPLEVAKSTFVMPRNKSEGRDPFHPSSTYPYDQNVSRTDGVKPIAPTFDLKLTGIGGTSDRRIANINSRAFGEGEDGEMTVNGSKVFIHIEKILEDSVILTVNGEQRELQFRRFFK